MDITVASAVNITVRLIAINDDVQVDDKITAIDDVIDGGISPETHISHLGNSATGVPSAS